MKELKVIGQFLASIIYTCIYAGLLYMLLIFPTAWFMTLSTKTMILVAIFLGGIIEGILVGANVLLLMPYYWIVKNNIVAVVVSIVLLIFSLGRAGVLLWKNLSDYGTTGTIVSVIVTLLLVQGIITAVFCILSAYKDEK